MVSILIIGPQRLFPPIGSSWSDHKRPLASCLFATDGYGEGRSATTCWMIHATAWPIKSQIIPRVLRSAPCCLDDGSISADWLSCPFPLNPVVEEPMLISSVSEERSVATGTSSTIDDGFSLVGLEGIAVQDVPGVEDGGEPVCDGSRVEVVGSGVGEGSEVGDGGRVVGVAPRVGDGVAGDGAWVGDGGRVVGERLRVGDGGRVVGEGTRVADGARVVGKSVRVGDEGGGVAERTGVAVRPTAEDS
jgi:hypothetical protein